ncbi:Gfo/Idh/MocA family protein [Haliangium ochraceum]|uniref:Oxidoreductase domain protein n=1 Tax=Haliangium ochraceum (strain DSM 14365 / JCM 11303 / SMP-2) TaxID=502025 RepID=D0LK89_HALO1|nr:Gfo/Idh/MocA family oxidoreductase [Haliangium ochraceum]ACY13123.1 oxidoreductase domain protein [Haliangium ochraceum DSM 14365]
MSTELKVALVGCGQIADGHVSEIQKLGNAKVLGVCDLEPLMAEQLAERYDVPHHYADYHQMLEMVRPDVVHICTPPGSHLALTKAAVDAGAHVYVEKPLALDYDQSVELVQYVEKAGRKLTIGHNSEFDPPSLEMRKLLAQGVIGQPVHIESWFGYNLGGPFGKVILGSPDHWVHRLPGKLFQNNINHMLNKITEFITDERPEVKAMAWRRDTSQKFGDVRDELMDELRVIIRGEKVSAYGTFTAAVKPVAHFSRVYGTESIAHLDFISRTVTVDRGATLPSAIGRLAAGFSQAAAQARSALDNARRFAASDYHFFAGMNELIRRFYDSILSDAPLPIATRDMLRIAWIMDEIFAQIGKPGRSHGDAP